MKEGFPVDILKKTYTVLDLFCAAFEGNQDVLFLREAGIREVLLVDKNEEKLMATSRKYHYPFKCMDIMKALEEDYDFGKFDIVICDQWSNQDAVINGKYFKKLKSMANKYLLLSCTEAYLKGRRTRDEFYYRSDYLGGVYWRVVKI